MKRKTFIRELMLYAQETSPESIPFIKSYELRFKSSSPKEWVKQKRSYKLPKVFDKSTYAKYLETDLWKTIRTRVFNIKGKKCEGCGATSRLQVHHSVYSQRVSEGKSLNGLRVVCNTCHETIHRITGMSLRKATKRVLDDKVNIQLIKEPNELDILKKMAKKIK